MELIQEIWLSGVLIVLLTMMLIGYSGKWTVRKLSYLMSLLGSPLMSAGIPIGFGWIGVPYNLIVGILALPIIVFIAYKANRGGKDIVRNENRGVTGTTYKIITAQKKNWDLLTDNEKEEWKNSLELEKPIPTPLWILVLINLIFMVLAYSALYFL